MKPKFLFLFLLLTNLIPLIAQQGTGKNSIFNVETGTKNYYIIQMESGTTYHARIVTVDNNKVLLMNPNGNTFTVQTGEIKDVIIKTFDSKGSVGIGFGYPYAVLGLNLDFLVYKCVYISGGVGTAIIKTPTFSIGSKIFLRSGNHNWRPRLSFFYGDNSSINSEMYNIQEIFPGFTFGIGQQYTLGLSKSWGIDLDITISEYSKMEQRAKELQNNGYDLGGDPSPISFSIGVRYCF